METMKNGTVDDPKLTDIVGRIKRGERLAAEDVVEVTLRYPYFTLPAFTLLKNQGNELDAETELMLTRHVAASTSDPRSLYALMGDSAAMQAGFYPDETPRKVTTDNAIDTFLSAYGNTSPEENAMLERMIFNPTPDYSQILAQEEQENLPGRSEAEPGSPDDRLNAFILKQKEQEGAIPSSSPQPSIPPEEQRSDTPPKPAADNSLLSASLAKIFIKQGHYERAYEIISQLSLNYPEKSIYFADQMRFLKKLIEHQRRANQ